MLFILITQFYCVIFYIIINFFCSKIIHKLTLFFFFLMIRRPPRSTLILTLFPYTTALPISPPHRSTRRAPSTHTLAHCLARARSEEHTSELQSHSEISYAVFCLKKKKN